MDLKTALPLLRQGLDLAEKAVPLAAALGLPSTNVASAVFEIARNVVDRIEDGSAALESSDAAELKDILAKLQGLNDGLAAEVDAS